MEDCVDAGIPPLQAVGCGTRHQIETTFRIHGNRGMDSIRRPRNQGRRPSPPSMLTRRTDAIVVQSSQVHFGRHFNSPHAHFRGTIPRFEVLVAHRLSYERRPESLVIDTTHAHERDRRRSQAVSSRASCASSRVSECLAQCLYTTARLVMTQPPRHRARV